MDTGAALGTYFFDSPKNIIFLIQRAETVIISFFSSVIETIISPLSDPTRLTLLLIVVFLLWSRIQTVITIIVTTLWKEKNEELQDEGSVMERKEQQRKELFKIYYGTNSWHSVFFKILDYVSLWLFYLIINFLTKIIFTSWEDKEFGVFDSIVSVLILAIALITAMQIFLEVSVICDEIIALQKGLDIEKLNYNRQDPVYDY